MEENEKDRRRTTLCLAYVVSFVLVCCLCPIDFRAGVLGQIISRLNRGPLCVVSCSFCWRVPRLCGESACRGGGPVCVLVLFGDWIVVYFRSGGRSGGPVALAVFDCVCGAGGVCARWSSGWMGGGECCVRAITEHAHHFTDRRLHDAIALGAEAWLLALTMGASMAKQPTLVLMKIWPGEIDASRNAKPRAAGALVCLSVPFSGKTRPLVPTACISRLQPACAPSHASSNRSWY